MELEVYKKSDFYEDYIDSQKEYYERENADAYFAEKLAEKDKEIAELKAKLEDAKATAYAESVDSGMRERRLKRTLYKACANWAYATIYYGGVHEYDEHKWEDMVTKCRAMAEEYK